MEEPSEREIILLNVSLTAGFSVVRGLIGGRFDHPREVLRAFTSGAVGGYGFYQSKRLIGRGQLIGGLALAYGSASIVENTSSGHTPLSFVRFGIGPIDLKIRTPFADPETRNDQASVSVQLNALTAAGTILLPLFDYRPTVHRGILVHRSPDILGRAQSYPRRAVAFNRTVVLGPTAPTSDLQHELIHFVQSLQIGAATPYYTAGTLGFELPQPPHTVTWDVQLDWLYAVLGLISLHADYEDRWAEIEAYTLHR